MKKSVLALAMAFGVTGAFAQDLTSKKGEPFLPEAGDWSIGIDASPFLNYAGQMLSNAGATSPGFQFLNSNQTIIGKMYKDEKTAYRAIVRLGMTSNSWTAEVAKPQPSTATPPSFPTKSEVVEDELKSSSSFIGLGGGIEMRRGKTRLQGFYGGEAMLWSSGNKDKFTYGNALTQGATTDPNVSVNDSHNWGPVATGGSGQIAYDNIGGAGSIPNYNGVTGSRITEAKNTNGGVFGFGVRGFIGAEYFIIPKISVAGEFGWGLGIVTNKKTTVTYEAEGFNSTPSEVKADITTETKNGKTFRIDTDQNMFGTGSATLRLNLHF